MGWSRGFWMMKRPIRIQKRRCGGAGMLAAAHRHPAEGQWGSLRCACASALLRACIPSEICGRCCTAARPLVAPAWRQDGQWVHRIPTRLCYACFSDNGMRLDADWTTTAARRRSANKGADGRSERSASCHGSISTRTTRFCASMLCGFSRPDSRASTFRIVVPHVRNH